MSRVKSDHIRVDHRHRADMIVDGETGEQATFGGGSSWIGPFTLAFADYAEIPDSGGDGGWMLTEHFQEGDIILHAMAISDEAFTADDGGTTAVSIQIGDPAGSSQMLGPSTGDPGFADPTANYLLNGILTPQIGTFANTFAAAYVAALLTGSELVWARVVGDPPDGQGSMRVWFEVIRA